MYYKIKITGKGTKKELVSALREMADDLRQLPDTIEDIDWEGETITTQMSEIDEAEYHQYTGQNN